ncbi:uncharacterized protein LOC117643790 [Thrips palmi]|uniref:Uncharacterized protein LOC117643790 n=1 Tax=Thrips palmi TaxID=161013 RepID=A0A6P8ZLF7_THRPL|nr:uncharacterized protein LOC117643790 [Thrips palmi]
MLARCALLGCRPGEKPKLHKFPANKVLAELCANFVSEHNVSTGKGPGKPYSGATVCRLHFIPTCYKTSSGRLGAGSVPSIPPQQVFSPSSEETNMSQNKESKESNAEGQSGAEDVCPSEIVTWIRDEESLDPDEPDDPDVDGPTLPSKRKRSLFNEFEAMEEGSKMDCEAAPLPNIEECEVSTGSVKEAATPPPSKPPQSEPLSPGEIESLMRETSRKKYPGDITEDDFVSPHSRRRAFNILQDALAESKRELANTKKSFKRLEQKYKTLQDIVMELRKNNFLSIEGQRLLEVKLKF